MVSDVSVLFCRRDSVYKTFVEDCYDIDRDGRLYSFTNPIVAHPPCRGWGRLYKLAKPRPDEKELARYAVIQVRRVGGVLEHPEFSKLWPDMGLPVPGAGKDTYGGWTLSVDQSWFGHKARKRTWLYIVGCDPGRIPVYPLSLDTVQYCVCHNRLRKSAKPEISRSEREHSPIAFAKWLVDLASNCRI